MANWKPNANANTRADAITNKRAVTKPFSLSHFCADSGQCDADTCTHACANSSSFSGTDTQSNARHALECPSPSRVQCSAR